MTALYVTGGGAGIGRAVVEGAGAHGFAVAALDLAEERAVEAALAAQRAGAPAAVGVACDVRDSASVESAFARATELVGPADALVCSAGIDRGGRIHEIDETQWRDVVETNLGGMYRACRQVLPAMLEARAGSIVCVGSPAGEVAFPGAGAYSASKAGVAALVRAMAVDYAGHGIRVNGVLPGPTNTDLMWANVRDDEREQMLALITGELPIGRLAEPHEIARMVLWLVSDEASYTTGSMLGCDGGVLARASVSF